jgi:hypothetical protein
MEEAEKKYSNWKKSFPVEIRITEEEYNALYEIMETILKPPYMHAYFNNHKSFAERFLKDYIN